MSIQSGLNLSAMMLNGSFNQNAISNVERIKDEFYKNSQKVENAESFSNNKSKKEAKISTKS